MDSSYGHFDYVYEHILWRMLRLYTIYDNKVWISMYFMQFERH